MVHRAGGGVYKVIKGMCKEAKIKGLFSGHSLRRSSTTRMFQGGIDKKIIREVTGHQSHALDAYEITSAEQKRQVSEVMAHNPANLSVDLTKKPNVASATVTNDLGTEYSNINADNVGSMVNDIVKIEIEITHE